MGYQNMNFYIGPGCSADGTTIGLKLYMNEECSYPASDQGISFADLSMGMWSDGLPFENGGLVSLNCVNCYDMNDDYEYEVSELCEEAFEQKTSTCEMDSFGMVSYNNNNNNNYNGGYNNGQQNYYQQQYYPNSNGCDYINSLLVSVYYSSSLTDSVVETITDVTSFPSEIWKRPPVVATLVIVAVGLVAGATAFLYCAFVRKSKCAEDDLLSNAKSAASSEYVLADDTKNKEEGKEAIEGD